ncbi:MAG TPA: hypothetical protein VFX96_12755, partial [Pyrinomonadaceae bacterium]|nr:hypothetical protein [Pyrinomonadaceae bacterium]
MSAGVLALVCLLLALSADGARAQEAPEAAPARENAPGTAAPSNAWTPDASRQTPPAPPAKKGWQRTPQTQPPSPRAPAQEEPPPQPSPTPVSPTPKAAPAPPRVVTVVH